MEQRESPGDKVGRRMREAKSMPFFSGSEAFKGGKPHSDNPYKQGGGEEGQDRYLWFQGYYAERLLQRLKIPYAG